MSDFPKDRCQACGGPKIRLFGRLACPGCEMGNVSQGRPAREYLGAEP